MIITITIIIIGQHYGSLHNLESSSWSSSSKTVRLDGYSMNLFFFSTPFKCDDLNLDDDLVHVPVWIEEKRRRKGRSCSLSSSSISLLLPPAKPFVGNKGKRLLIRQGNPTFSRFESRYGKIRKLVQWKVTSLLFCPRSRSSTSTIGKVKVNPKGKAVIIQSIQMILTVTMIGTCGRI